VFEHGIGDLHPRKDRMPEQSGFTLGLSGSVGDAINSAVNQAEAASSGAGDARATALHAFAAAGNSAIAVAGMTGGALAGSSPSIGVQLSFGTNQSKSNASEDQTSHIGSAVQAGGTASFVATGDGSVDSGNIKVAGSNVSANDVLRRVRTFWVTSLRTSRRVSVVHS
jgi:filamentous hemagglutinin